MQKNFRSKQVAQILHQKASRDAAGKATKVIVRGKEVPDKKLKTYIRRTTKKPQIQLRDTGVETSAASGTDHDMVPVVLCRTPSPVPSSSPQMALLASNSPPVWDEYVQQESTLFFGMYPSPWAAFPCTPNIPELWETFQDEVPVVDLSDEQDPSASSTSIGVFNQSHPNRSAISCRRTSTAPAISHLFPLAMPDILGKSEECLYLLRDYVSERFDSGSWNADNFMEGISEVTDWYNLAGSARLLLIQGHEKQALRILDRCSDQYATLLSAPSFDLFFSTCCNIIRLSNGFPDLATSLIRHARYISQLKLNKHHPFGNLLERMCLMDIMELRQSLRSLLDCYGEYLEITIDQSSEFMIDVILSRCNAVSTLYEGGFLDPGVTEAHMKSSLVAMELYGDLGRTEALDIKRYLAEFYYQKDRFDEARLILSELLASADLDKFYDLEIMENCYDLLFRISRNEGRHDEIVRSMNQWMSFTKAHFGLGDRYIDALSDWEEYLRENNDVDLADKTFRDLDTAVEELCVDFEEFLVFDADEDGS